MFYSYYDLIKSEHFLKNITPIVLFSCLGTIISASVIGLILWLTVKSTPSVGFSPTIPEIFTFACLISTTDPVSTLAVFQQKRIDPKLFYLVFGESVLNDAVGLVLFNTLSKFVGQKDTGFQTIFATVLFFLIDFFVSFVGSLMLGCFCGIAAGFLLKKIDMKSTRLLELSSYILIMYIPFFMAELLPLSGIVTTLFTGLAAKQYAEPNLSNETAKDADLFFRVTAHLAETAIFLELGLSVFDIISLKNFHAGFIGMALIACFVGRFLNIYPLTFLLNRREAASIIRSKSIGDIENSQSTDENNETHDKCSTDEMNYSLHSPPSQREDYGKLINNNTAHMLMFSGLRGAVAYACAKSFPDNNGNRLSFVITTMVIILVTVFLFGGTTELALQYLDIQMNVDENEYNLKQKVNPSNNYGILETIGELYIFLFHYLSVSYDIWQNLTNTILLAVIYILERQLILPLVLQDYQSTPARMTDEDYIGGSSHQSEKSQTGEIELSGIEPVIDEKRPSLYDYGAN